MNKYLEKIAGRHDAVEDIIEHYQDRFAQIEQPIRDMHYDMDSLEEDLAGPEGLSYYQQRRIDDMRDTQEDHLRHSLDTEGQHTKNEIETATKLLAHAGIDHPVTEDNAYHIIHSLKVNRPSNGQIGLKNTIATVTTLGSGIGGVVLGARAFGKPGAVMGGVSGLVGGAILGHKGFGPLMQDRIDRRAEEIENEYDSNVDRAYQKLRNSFGVAKPL